MLYILEEKMFFIPYNVPSSKNSRGISAQGYSFPSKYTTKWKRLTKPFWKEGKELFRSLITDKRPILVGFHFIRGRDDLYDWINPVQTIQDEMTNWGWLDEDNVFELMPFPFKINGSYTSYDKNNPGVYIKILDNDT